MKQHHKHWTALALAAAVATVALTGCGGGGGGGYALPITTTGTGTSTGTQLSMIPASALTSTGAFIAYLKQLIAATSDTAAPVQLGNAVAPVDDFAPAASL